MRQALLVFVLFVFPHVIAPCKGDCGHARVKAFPTSNRRDSTVCSTATSSHSLPRIFFWRRTTDFNVVGVRIPPSGSLPSYVFHRVVHCLVLVSQIYNVIEIVNINMNNL